MTPEGKPNQTPGAEPAEPGYVIFCAGHLFIRGISSRRFCRKCGVAVGPCDTPGEALEALRQVGGGSCPRVWGAAGGPLDEPPVGP